MFDKGQSNQPCQAITAARLFEPFPIGGGMMVEPVLLTGNTGVAADTAEYTARFKVRSVVGAVADSISGATVTIKAGMDLGNDTSVALLVLDTRS